YRLNVTGIIIECPFGSMLQTVQARFNTMHLPTFPMANLLVFWGGLQNNFNAFKHNPSEYAKKINCPTLLLYGEKDEKVSRAEIDTIYKNLQGYKELKTYPLAAHENYLTKYKNEWEYDIGSFMWHITRFNQSTCLHTDLSKQFNFQTKIQRLPTVDGFDSSIAQVNIIDKATGKNTQTINYYSNYFFDDVFNNCNSCRSYTTGKNVNDIIADNNFGDILVADFNFDHKEDVALKHDSGGNGGPMYDFYLQAPDGKFYIDKYLSDSMRYFPVYFNPTNKTLATQVHANAYGENKNTFKFNPKTNTWQYIVSEFIEANK
ncbi:MAG TPA: hypothetical protein VKG26_05795, partial [Bacteroidia bacterium]|nr:hypothetical protein [Bacteroidia bacterium]